jgi:flagellar secretion chaperone FliS
MFQQRAARAADRYRNLDSISRTATASPYELVGILYENLDHALAAAAAAVELDKQTAIPIHLGRARSIIAALEGGLDFDQAPDLAATLAGIYRAMQRRLSDVSDYPAAILEVQSGVANMAASWKAIGTERQ